MGVRKAVRTTSQREMVVHAHEEADAEAAGSSHRRS